MEVYVKVECQNLETGERTITTTAILTMVAVDPNGKSTPVCGVHPETEEEQNLFLNAQNRKERRLKMNEFSGGKCK